MGRPKKTAKKAVLDRDEHRCVLAGPRCTFEATTVDHWIPMAHGGDNRQENLRASCDNCNQDKGDMMPDEWWSFLLLGKRASGNWDITDSPSEVIQNIEIPEVEGP